jgi:hypothetical protein
MFQQPLFYFVHSNCTNKGEGNADNTCGQLHEHFIYCTYNPIKISRSIHAAHAPMQCFQNEAAYIAMAKG